MESDFVTIVSMSFVGGLKRSVESIHLIVLDKSGLSDTFLP